MEIAKRFDVRIESFGSIHEGSDTGRGTVRNPTKEDGIAILRHSKLFHLHLFLP